MIHLIRSTISHHKRGLSEKYLSRNMDVDFDISDEVSALSMDGASAIAGRVMVKRLRKVFDKLQPGIAEDEEEEQAAPAVVVSIDNEWTDGCELLEPFPSSYEEWHEKKKKERKEMHKSKKHHKHSRGSRKSKDSSRGECNNSSMRRENQREQHQQQQHKKVEEASPPPIMEISIQPTRFPSLDSGPILTTMPTPPPNRRSRRSQEVAHDACSYPSIPSMEDSSNSRSAGVTKSLHQCRKNASSFAGSGAMGMAIKRTMDFRSAVGDTESLTQMSGHSIHTTGNSSTANQSHVTPENMEQLRIMLDHARKEEIQVMEIHKKLEREVQVAMTKEQMSNHQRVNIKLESQTASLEHERLERQLENLHKVNDELRSKLSILEERVDDRGLDDVLDSMEAKIKALKIQRTERKVSSPRGR